MADTTQGKTPAELILEAAQRAAQVRLAAREAAQAIYAQVPPQVPSGPAVPPTRA